MHTIEAGSCPKGETRLSDLVELVRESASSLDDGAGERFHVSVLDVDATGLIDIISASTNRPMSKGLACRAGDILVSCMNPRIWRVAVIPGVPGSWSCSPEFIVLRPRGSHDPWMIAVALHHPSVSQCVQAMAKGTSSSRQRVPKSRLLSVDVPQIQITEKLAEYVAWREDSYRKRLREAIAYRNVHTDGSGFFW